MHTQSSFLRTSNYAPLPMSVYSSLPTPVRIGITTHVNLTHTSKRKKANLNSRNFRSVDSYISYRRWPEIRGRFWWLLYHILFQLSSIIQV